MSGVSQKDALLGRFEAKFVPDPNSGCWLWTAAVNKDGYGSFFLAGRIELASRASWMVHRGKIPDGMCVLHRCDVPCCVNPHHLFLGTQLENALDRVAKGRGNHANTSKTHCKRRHPFSEENTLIENNGRRVCKICKGMRARKSYEKDPQKHRRWAVESYWRHRDARVDQKRASRRRAQS